MSSRPNLILYTNECPVPAPQPRFTREQVDLVNSICWLFMDACWMFSVPKVGLLFGLPSIMTGAWLWAIERKKLNHWIHLSTNCWIWMNVFWMLLYTFSAQEALYLTIAKSFLSAGFICVGVSAYKTGGLLKSLNSYKNYKRIELPTPKTEP